MAPNYLVKTSTDHLSSAEEEAIRNMLGWHKEIGPRLLASDTSHLKWIQLISAGADYMDFDKLREKAFCCLMVAESIVFLSQNMFLGVLLAHTADCKKVSNNKCNTHGIKQPLPINNFLGKNVNRRHRANRTTIS